ncbi:MAG: PAS domain-containing protein [Candidatus Krumholzibacteria bacterium]|nr:PAS domain-containing protein [Candidatus Krumholzibacteria bacterium]
MSNRISLSSLVELLDNSFDYLLVLDAEQGVHHLNRTLGELIGETRSGVRECSSLADIVESADLVHFQKAMQRVAAGERGVVVYWKIKDDRAPIIFKVSSSGQTTEALYLFRSSLLTDVADLSLKSDWEQIERAKELACLYSIGEWIHISTSIPEFFEHLYKYLGPGMLYPEHVRVQSIYKGQVFGKPPVGDQRIRGELKIDDEVVGKIEVGYDEEGLDVLPEEQKLLDEIARFLCLALERKSLASSLEAKKEEADEYSREVESLRNEVEKSTEELEKQQTQLRTVNTYLDRIHQGLDDSKQTLKNMFAAIPDTVALIDMDFNIVMTNQAEELAGKPCYEALFGLEAPCLDCRLKKIQKLGAPVTQEARHGDTYYSAHAMPVFGEENKIDGIIEFFRDITYQKTYEQQLQQADKLASLGQLVSGIGHEINNPNQFIRGNIKIVQQALEGLLPIVDDYYKTHPDLKIARLNYDFFREHIMVLVNDMSNGSERIKRIVESLKGFARKDEGLLVDRVDINNVIEESSRLVHSQVHKFADISLDLGSDIPVFRGNAQKLEQVLINLVINASQAMPDDTRGEIQISSRQDGEWAVVEVADNGSGMGEATVRNIFDPFFTTKRARGGTGLGLSIAFRIMEEHGGQISVSSTVGEGTTFTMRLPLGGKETDTEQEQGSLEKEG